ncbi:MAG: SusC/RagA family TonB-linked outer membrane protein [Tenuifilaceae bacterium]|nr:SusC/RagA family TonB-linked outer membrane protein [Tenuifilaceae bacterium]
MKKLFVFLACVVFVGVNFLQAQTVQITGNVTSSEDGMPIPGVSVQVKGTTIGVASDVDGKYSLSVPQNATTLIYTFLGFKNQEIVIGGRTVINVVLESDMLALEEVVVTALGISRDKKTLGYSVQQVQGDELNKVNQTDPLSALQGRVAGVQIRSTTNMGGSSKILIRGASSMLGDNNPLIIVDGIPMDNQNFNSTNAQIGNGGVDYGNMLNDINPGEIESMSVLRGAAAALYGSRAANGVIIITTKSAKKGKEAFSVDFSSSVDFEQVSVMPILQNKYGGGAYVTGAGSSQGFEEALIGGSTYLIPQYSVDESWGPRYDPNINVLHWWGAIDYVKGVTTTPETAPWVSPKNDVSSFWDLGKTFSNNIGVSKTGENYGIRFAYNNSLTQGTMPGSEMNKNSFKLASNASLTDRISVNSNLTYSSNYAKGRPETGYGDNSVTQKFFQWGQRSTDFGRLENYKNQDGTQRSWNIGGVNDILPKYADNPYWTSYENYSEDQRDRVYGNASLNIKITDDLSFNGGVYGDSYTFYVRERISLGSQASSFYEETVRVNTEFNYEGRLNYSKKINDIDLGGLVGANKRNVRYDRNTGTTSGGLIVPGLFTLSNSNDDPTLSDFTSEKTINSVFGQFSAGYKRFINMEVSMRNDWSSTLPEANNSYFYWGVAGSFVLTELVEIPLVNLAKVRAGRTQVGNDTDPYRIDPVYNYNGDGSFGTSPRLSVGTTMSNPDLKSETTTTTEFGLDLVAFQNRVDLSVTYFNKLTTDLIISLQTSRTTGYASKAINAGALSSKGWEISLGVIPVQTKDFQWQIRGNFTKSKMVVEELYGEIKTLDIANATFRGVTLRASLGDEYGQLWGYDFVYDDEGNKVVDGDGYWLRTPLTPLGSVYPSFNLGIANNFTYKNIDLGILLDIQQGGKFYSLTHMWAMYSGMLEETAGVNDKGNEMRDPVSAGGGVLNVGVQGDVAFNPDGTYTVTNTTPNTTYMEGADWAQAHYHAYGTPSAQSVFDADYIKLREVSLGYTFNKPLFNNAIKSVRLAAYGRNLATWGLDQPGFDPEMTVNGSGNIQGMEGGLQPLFRTFGFNLKLQF